MEMGRDIRDKSYKYLNLHDREGESEWMNLKKKEGKILLTASCCVGLAFDFIIPPIPGLQ